MINKSTGVATTITESIRNDIHIFTITENDETNVVAVNASEDTYYRISQGQGYITNHTTTVYN